MKPLLRTRIMAVIIMLIAIGLSACDLSLPRSKAGVTSTVLSDTHVAPVPVGQEVIITSDHRSEKGIQEVKFLVQGNEVSVQRPPFPDVQFIVENRWTPPAEGSYAVSIVAVDTDGGASTTDLNITAERGIIPVATRVKAKETLVPAPSLPIDNVTACSNDAEFITDVTIPDGTQLDPSAVFSKTWRIQNSGTCNWPAGFTFAHVGGPTLGGTTITLQALPSRGEVDITIPMRAPAGGGSYRSDWRVHDQNSQPFGKIFTADIVVPETCQAPTINQFTASPTEINAGESSTLSWEVEGADTLTLKPGPQVTGEDSSAKVSPTNTTTYILEAKTDNCVETAELTVTVNQVSGKPSAPANFRIKALGQTNMFFAWDDTSDNEVEFQLFDANTNTRLFTYSANAIEGRADGLTCNTAYSWQLHAINGQGLSEPSNIVEATTNACN